MCRGESAAESELDQEFDLPANRNTIAVSASTNHAKDSMMMSAGRAIGRIMETVDRIHSWEMVDSQEIYTSLDQLHLPWAELW